MGVEPTGIKITAARTRYGSCSGKNSLCFSCFLMNCPEEANDLTGVDVKSIDTPAALQQLLDSLA